MELINKILIDNMNHKEWKIVYQDIDGIRLQDNNGVEVNLTNKTVKAGINCGEFDIKSDINEDMHPDYYNFRIRDCTGIQLGFIGNKGLINFYEGNILKYLYRYPKKNNVEDLIKARTYLNMLIDIIKNEGD